MAILTDQAMAFIYARQFDRAIEQLRKLIAIDPNFVRTHFYLSEAYQGKGMYAEAIESRKKGVLLDGMDPLVAETIYKRMVEAVKRSGANGYWQVQMDLDLERAKQDEEPVDVMEIAINHANLGNTDKAFSIWKRVQRPPRRICFLKADYIWDKIRNDPRYDDLIRRIGLP
jgi:tetratricopeptide (TPR) repeat protein